MSLRSAVMQQEPALGAGLGSAAVPSVVKCSPAKGPLPLGRSPVTVETAHG